MDEAGVLRLVADPTRFAILARLLQGSSSVGELVEAAQQEQSNVSHHLKALRQAGIVQASRRGRHQHYQFSDPAVQRIFEEILGLARRLENAGYTAALGLPVDAMYHGYG